VIVIRCIRGLLRARPAYESRLSGCELITDLREIIRMVR
jgi:hypothetical protein